MRPLVLLILVSLLPGCQGCSGNGHVAQTPFFAAPQDDVVNCVCNLTFDNDHCTDNHCAAHFSIELCLPPALQGADGGAGGPVPDGGNAADSYSARVDQFCHDVATHAVYHMIKVFNGGWCEYKAPYAPQGGVGSSVYCFAEEYHDGAKRATRSDDGTCRAPCAPVPCDYNTNCGSDVQDAEGNVHPDRCRCSIVTRYGCPGDPANDLPTPLFCRAQP